MMKHLFYYLTLCTFIWGVSPAHAQLTDSLHLISGQNQVTDAPNGVAYDSGGPQFWYNNGEFSTLLIDPGCAEQLVATVTFYSVESCCDYLSFYDGDSANGIPLGNVNSTGWPVTFTSTTGKLFVVWYSDGSVVYDGFRFQWSSVLTPPVAPVATFDADDLTPALQQTVAFSATATNFPIAWAWSFGDGNVSNLQNPTHVYTSSGPKNVRLVSTNCHGLKDTVDQTLTVQGAPAISILPLSDHDSVSCGETAYYQFGIVNTGQGDLLFSADAHLDGNLKLGLVSDYANPASLLGLGNLLGFYTSDYETTPISLYDPVAAAPMLEELDILIFPTLDLGDPWPLMNSAGLVQDFLAQGGSVIICGQSGYNAPGSAYNLFPGSDWYTQQFSGVNITLQTNHPITAGLPSVLLAPVQTSGFTVNTPDYVSLCTASGRSILGFRALPKGNIVNLGFGFQSFNAQLAKLLTQTLDWCGQKITFTLSPEAGVVAPGDTVLLDLSLPTTGYTPGLYNGVLLVSSNTPSSALVEAPFSLEVSGSPSMEWQPDTITFAPMMQGRQDSVVVAFDNIGCADLAISGISIPNGFAIPGLPDIIPAFTDSSLTIYFQPQDTGWYSGTCILATNDGPLSIPLSGYAFGRPVLSWQPDSLTVSVGCGDSVLVSFVVENTGIGDLEMSFQGGSGAGGITPTALILDAVSYNTNIGGNIDYWLQNKYNDIAYQVQHYTINQTSDGLAAAINSSDLVVIPNYYNTWWMAPGALGAILREYMENGGTVVFTGSSFFTEFNQLGFSNVVNWIATFPQYYGYEQPTHRLVEGVNTSAAGPDAVFGWDIIDAEWERVVNLGAFPSMTAAGYKKIGSGQVIYLGFEFNYDSEPGASILGNAIRWARENATIGAIEPTLTVGPGATDTVELMISAGNLLQGAYPVTANWTTNDPDHPVLSLPISLQVTGAPVLSVGATQLNFGLVQQYATKLLPIEVENLGCDTLHLQQLSLSNSDFFVENAPDHILPYSTGEIVLGFQSVTVGAKTGTLSITSNGGNQDLALSGVTVGAPYASVAPLGFSSVLACRETKTDTVQISNTGLSGLSYSFSGSPVQKRYGILYYGATYGRYWNVVNIINSTQPGAVIVPIETPNVEAFADTLSKVEVLIIPSLDFPGQEQQAVYQSFAPLIQDFLAAGNTVLVLGVNAPTALGYLGLFNSPSFQGLGFPSVKAWIKNHPLVADLDSEWILDDNATPATFNAAEGMVPVWVTQDQWIHLGYKVVGNGIVAYLGNSCDYNNVLSRKMVSNTLNWLFNPYPPGVTPAPKNGSLQVGQSHTTSVHYDGTGLRAGVYPGFIRFTSNAPLQDNIKIPVSLTMDAAPCANFSYNSSSCNSLVVFKDESLNGIFSWYWQFGDGFDSFGINPSHNYEQAGEYVVTLVACNGTGCDTAQQTITIYPETGPIPAVCSPGTSLALCCATGIYSVQLGSAILNTGNGAEEGYQDNSCSLGTEMVYNLPYELRVSTGNQTYEYVSAWLDFNNNGNFEPSELLFNDASLVYHSGIVTAPATAVLDEPLRLRIISESTSYAPPTPCGSPQNGQVEDYYVIVRKPSGTSQLVANDSFDIYPNPSVGNFWLQTAGWEARELRIAVMDATGRAVYETAVVATGAPINIQPATPLASGVWWVRIQTDKVGVVKPLVVHR